MAQEVGNNAKNRSEDASYAEDLLQQVKVHWKSKKNFQIRWEPGYKKEALSLARRNGITGYQGGCPPCELHLVNFIRDLAGYPPVQQEDKSLRDRRLEICKGCEHYKPLTKSCGTLILGAFNRKPGEPCGCYLPLKASFAMFDCPMIPSKWKDVQ